ncbi:hypothetical protein Fmac_021411 [Flemingia macrophylla]|uniref:Uncharacterized protein n=1 Tax=Flemingia macrophylla TaxID=520843 RepID=A0ABD1LWW9_9FABA
MCKMKNIVVCEINHIFDKFEVNMVVPKITMYNHLFIHCNLFYADKNKKNK